ncbi:50S ribosomal protein L6 [Pelagibius marinus]|uniref:50S ribosomal protein L6 n=1 Tax=Pelagibius marinus TaxID=2762760 RepID=UPI001872A188|nr:50S ribosomal protein L6 [Pelagibius marinus]
MSRVGKNPVEVPAGVEVAIKGGLVSAKGKLGTLDFQATDDVQITQEDNKVWVKPVNETKKARAMWGTARSRIQNMVQGVSEGFTKELEINGVGYRAAVQGQALNLQLGFSHDVSYPIPEGITIKCEKPTSISISGADKQKVGQVAAEIRSYRPPEPYKGKGVKYADEVILRKEGKKK